MSETAPLSAIRAGAADIFVVLPNHPAIYSIYMAGGFLFLLFLFFKKRVFALRSADCDLPRTNLTSLINSTT